MKNNIVQKNIPSGWQEVRLANIGVFSKGAGISKEQLSSSGNNAVRYGELYTKFDFQIKKIYSYIPDDIISQTKKIKFGDILFAGSGETIDEIGKSAAYLINEECYAGGDIIIFTPKGVDSLFLSYFLNVGEARKKLRELGQGQSVVHIYKSDLENVSLHLPILPEQKRIVAVLETWDQAIEKLAKKIEIKKNIKKGLMQNLLTGKIRLAGFSEKWKTVKLSDVAKVVMGQSPMSSAYNANRNGLPLVQGNNDIKNGKTIERVWTTEITKKVGYDEIIMTVRAPVGSIGISSGEICIGRGVCAIIPEKINKNFLLKFLEKCESSWRSLEQGSTFSAISGADIRGIEINVPISDGEQDAISNIIVIADGVVE